MEWVGGWGGRVEGRGGGGAPASRLAAVTSCGTLETRSGKVKIDSRWVLISTP